MPKIRTKRTEHYKVADFTFVEIEAEIEDEYPDSKTGISENHKELKRYFEAARTQLKDAFAEGAFDIAE